MPRKKKENTEEQLEVEVKANKAIGPYDIINMIFTDYAKFQNLTDVILDKNFFLINRVFSIKYPLQGAIFNKTTINTAAVIKAWATFLLTKERYGRVPYFVYSKGAKKSADATKTVEEKLDKDLICKYCKRYGISSLKDFDTLRTMYKDELIADVKRYEKIISLKEQEKSIS